MILLIANVLPICEKPTTRKGRFITISRTDREIPVICCTNNDIPVTPPSIKEFGSKNPFNPKPADAIANKIRKIKF